MRVHGLDQLEVELAHELQVAIDPLQDWIDDQCLAARPAGEQVGVGSRYLIKELTEDHGAIPFDIRHTKPRAGDVGRRKFQARFTTNPARGKCTVTFPTSGACRRIAISSIDNAANSPETGSLPVSSAATLTCSPSRRPLGSSESVDSGVAGSASLAIASASRASIVVGAP